MKTMFKILCILFVFIFIGYASADCGLFYKQFVGGNWEVYKDSSLIFSDSVDDVTDLQCVCNKLYYYVHDGVYISLYEDSTELFDEWSDEILDTRPVGCNLYSSLRDGVYIMAFKDGTELFDEWADTLIDVRTVDQSVYFTLRDGVYIMAFKDGTELFDEWADTLLDIQTINSLVYFTLQDGVYIMAFKDNTLLFDEWASDVLDRRYADCAMYFTLQDGVYIMAFKDGVELFDEWADTLLDVRTVDCSVYYTLQDGVYIMAFKDGTELFDEWADTLLDLLQVDDSMYFVLRDGVYTMAFRDGSEQFDEWVDSFEGVKCDGGNNPSTMMMDGSDYIIYRNDLEIYDDSDYPVIWNTFGACTTSSNLCPAPTSWVNMDIYQCSGNMRQRQQRRTNQLCNFEYQWVDFACPVGDCFGLGECSAPACGNTIPDPGEECDDGDLDTSDSCPDAGGPGGACLNAVCGDSYIWNTDGGIETCDDGDSQLNDNCPDGALGTCQSAFCGDGFVWNIGGTETCDDGDSDNSDSCPDGIGGICAAAFCGDGFVWSTDGGAEDCDDGDSDNSDSCPDGAGGTCAAAVCGDNIVWSSDGGTEECDGSSDAACPGLCEAPASATPCMCNFSPVATLVAAPTSGDANLTVIFTASCTDAEGSMDTCALDFDDGNSFTFSSTAGGLVPHDYIIGGSFNATLTALDTTGLSDTDAKVIDVTSPSACVISSADPVNFYKDSSTVINVAYTSFLADPTLIAINCGGPVEGTLVCDPVAETCTISCGPYSSEGVYTVDGLVLDNAGTPLVCSNSEILTVMGDPDCSIDTIVPSTPITPGVSISVEVSYTNFASDPSLDNISCGSTAISSGFICNPITETCVVACGAYTLEGIFNVEDLVLDLAGTPVTCSGSESVVVSSAPACTIDFASPNVFSTGDSTTLTASYINFTAAPNFVGVNCGDVTVASSGGACAAGSCTFDCGPYNTENTYAVTDLILDNGDNVTCLGSVAVTATDSAFCSISVDDPSIPINTSTDLTVNFGNFDLDPVLESVLCGGSANMLLFTSCDSAPDGVCAGTCGLYDSEGLYGVSIGLYNDLEVVDCSTDSLAVFNPVGAGGDFAIDSFEINPTGVIIDEGSKEQIVARVLVRNWRDAEGAKIELEVVNAEGLTVVGPFFSKVKNVTPSTIEEFGLAENLFFDVDDAWPSGNYSVIARVVDDASETVFDSKSKFLNVGFVKSTAVPETSLFLIPMLLAVVLFVLKKR